MLTLLLPYSSELNPVERVWRWLRDRKLSNRVLPAGAELDALLGDVFNSITAQQFRSICNVP